MAGAAAAQPEIDTEMLRFLASESQGGLVVQVERFLASFDADRIEARRALEEGQPDAVRRIFHRILSHCSVVKYGPLSRLASELHRDAAASSREDLIRTFDEFEREFALFRCKLESTRA